MLRPKPSRSDWILKLFKEAKKKDKVKSQHTELKTEIQSTVQTELLKSASNEDLEVEPSTENLDDIQNLQIFGIRQLPSNLHDS